MFFSGDPSTRKRVDLGGRSSKEMDREKFLEKTRLERSRRLFHRQLFHRQQNSAALKIQKCYRGRKAVAVERASVRGEFFMTYGNHCQNVNRHCFGSDSDFFRQLLFFLNPQEAADFSALVETCQCLLQYVLDSGNVVSLFAGVDYASKQALVGYRVKQLAYACIWAVYQNRNQLKDQLFLACDNYGASTVILLETVGILIDSRLPWSCKTVGYLLQRNAYALCRDIILTGKDIIRFEDFSRVPSSVETVLALTIPHVYRRSFCESWSHGALYSPMVVNLL